MHLHYLRCSGHEAVPFEAELYDVDLPADLQSFPNFRHEFNHNQLARQVTPFVVDP